MTEKLVIVRAGVPGMYGADVDGEHYYPATTTDFAKLLREHGFVVDYEHERPQRTVVDHKAADLWLPILDFTMNVLANIPANIVATLIMDFFRGSREDVDNSILHVKYSIQDQSGQHVTFEAEGSGVAVMKAMREFDDDIRR